MVLCCYFSIISLCYNYCVQQKNSTTIATHNIVTAKTDIVLFTQGITCVGTLLIVAQPAVLVFVIRKCLNKQKIEQDGIPAEAKYEVRY